MQTKSVRHDLHNNLILILQKIILGNRSSRVLVKLQFLKKRKKLAISQKKYISRKSQFLATSKRKRKIRLCQDGERNLSIKVKTLSRVVIRFRSIETFCFQNPFPVPKEEIFWDKKIKKKFPWTYPLLLEDKPIKQLHWNSHWARACRR